MIKEKSASILNQSSPLVDVAFRYMCDNNPYIPVACSSTIIQILSRFIEGSASITETASKLSYYAENLGFLKTIKIILNMGDKPLQLDAASINGNECKKNRQWTCQEDYRLLLAVHKFGVDSWRNVAAFVGNGRTRSQCSQRWQRDLNPYISRLNWTPDEELRLLSYVGQYGRKSWSKISLFFGNRSDIQCRYHFMQIVKRYQQSNFLKSRFRLAMPALNQNHKQKRPENPHILELNENESLFLFENEELAF